MNEEYTIETFCKNLRADLGNVKTSLINSSNFGRCVARAVLKVSLDIDKKLIINSNNKISPKPTKEIRQLIELSSKHFACQMILATSANYFIFSSGDKKIDKSKIADHWKDLANKTKREYETCLNLFYPNISLKKDESIITDLRTRTIIFEQGKVL